MTLAVAEALNPNKQNFMPCYTACSYSALLRQKAVSACRDNMRKMLFNDFYISCEGVFFPNKNAVFPDVSIIEGYFADGWQYLSAFVE